VYRLLTGRWPFLAVALLLLLSQEAVASHIPALDDEPVSKCSDGSKHFCPEVAPEHSGPCALCQAGTGGIAFTLDSVVETVGVAEAFVQVDEAGAGSSLKFSPAAPRAPPVG